MSGSINEDTADLRARDIEAHAAEWIERRACGDWRDSDQENLDKWLSEFAHP